MAMPQIMFECTRLKGTGKAGTITPDKDGCYTMVVGGLNVHNAHGDLYVYDAAKHFFENNSAFMRRVNRGVLRGEVDHPQKQPGMTFREYGARLMNIDPNQVCCTHRQIWLDFDHVTDTRTGKPIIAIMSKVWPGGVKGDFLKEMIEANGEQVCFSIRSFVNETPMSNGRMCKAIRDIVTFDYVNEPGIEFAEKFRSPACESLVDLSFTQSDIESIVKNNSIAGSSMESAGLSPTLAKDLFSPIEVHVNPKAYLGW